MEMQGLRLGWERSCPHALYSPACGVHASAYRITADVLSVDGAAIYSGAFAGEKDGYFTSGFIEWTLPGGDLERRAIQLHEGSRVQLLGGAAGLQAGLEIRIYPGCAQTVESCNTFKNLANYGGFPHLSGQSPYGINIF